MAVLSVSGWCPDGSNAYAALLPGSMYVSPPAGSSEFVIAQLFDNNLVPKGPLQFVTMQATLYYNAVGTWSMVVPYSDMLWNMMMSGDFIVEVGWRQMFSFGGKCEQPGFQNSIPGASAGSQSGPFITLAGADYLGLIANRICYPSPGAAWSAQTSAATDAVSNTRLETAIKHYVTNNIGSGAISSRRHSLLDVGTDLARGNLVSYTVKFGSGVDLNLLDVIRAMIASSNASMGVTVKRSYRRLTFDVYVPRDLSGKILFSESLGNLTSSSFYLTDPTCTDSLVQGSGTTFVQSTASGRTQWNAVEQFNDSSSETDINNLNATAQQALAAGGFGPNMSVTPVDTPFVTFGRDYFLGDIVSIEVNPGAVYKDVISSVQLTADMSQNPQVTAVPAIGNSSNATATDQNVISQLSARIRALEKKLSNK